MYGQTGTGKTYTMGTLETIKREDQGLIPLSLNYLINYFSEEKNQGEWTNWEERFSLRTSHIPSILERDQ